MPTSNSTPECPECGTQKSSTQNTKPTQCGGRVRRRVCLACGHSWYTFQSPEVVVDKEQVYWGRRYIHVLPAESDLSR